MSAEKLTRDDLVEIIYQSNLSAGLDTAEETLCDVLSALVTILNQEGYWRAVPIGALSAMAEPEDHYGEGEGDVIDSWPDEEVRS